MVSQCTLDVSFISTVSFPNWLKSGAEVNQRGQLNSKYAVFIQELHCVEMEHLFRTNSLQEGYAVQTCNGCIFQQAICVYCVYVCVRRGIGGFRHYSHTDLAVVSDTRPCSGGQINPPPQPQENTLLSCAGVCTDRCVHSREKVIRETWSERRAQEDPPQWPGVAKPTGQPQTLASE